MKLLKCIINDYSTNGNTGFININFNQNINIAPYSSIAFDKIAMVILPNPSGTITLEADQTIFITTQNTGNKPSPRRSVILPKGTYTYNETAPYVPNQQLNTYPDLVDTLNKLFNGILNGTPLQSVTGATLDIGLGFKWTGAVSTTSPPVYKLTLNSYQMKWVGGGTAQAALTPTNTLNIDSLNVNSVESKNGFSSTVAGNFFVRNLNPIIMGCVQSAINIQLPLSFTSLVNYGLCLATTAGVSPIVEYGISFEGDYAYIINNRQRTTQLPIADFRGANPTSVVNMYMYTDASTGSLRFMVEDISGVQGYTTDVNAYTGYNVNTPYFLCVNGINRAPDLQINFYAWRGFNQPNINVDNDGIYYEVPEQKLYLVNSGSYTDLGLSAPNRQIQIDLSRSQLLIKSLGLGLNIIQGNVSDTTQFSYTAPQGIDFVNYYDLGLDVLNLSLESYVGFSNGKGSGKKNSLAYFLMQRISDNDSLFYNEQKQMIFLSLENKSAMSVSSLQFRIYDVNTGLPISLTNGSFNLYIGDKGDDSGHNSMPATRYMEAVHNIAQF
jgi:hypothetical protein